METIDERTDDEMGAYHGFSKHLIHISVCGCNFDLIL